ASGVESCPVEGTARSLSVATELGRGPARVAVGQGVFDSRAGRSGHVLNREARQRRESRTKRRVVQRIERSEGSFRFAARKLRGVFESPGALDCRNDGLELSKPPFFDRETDGGLLRAIAMPQRMNEGQSRFAFGEIVAEILASFGGVGAVVQNVVHELIGGAQVPAVGRKALLDGDRAAGENGG